MFRQNVDLAARFSAVICRDEGGEVLDQWDSRDLSPFQVAARLGRTARDPECELTLVENLPAHDVFQTDRVYRYQGLIMMANWKTVDDLLFIDPATWMRYFPGVKELMPEQKVELKAMGLTKAQAKALTLKWRTENMRLHGERLGFTAPDLVAEWQAAHPELKPLKKYTNDLEKNKTDYVAAFLISEYGRALSVEELRTTQGVTPAYI